MDVYDWIMLLAQSVGDCLEFTGGTMIDGYSQLRDPSHNRARLAHVIVAEHHLGPCPPGLQVMHSCDNRVCVNILHLPATALRQRTSARRFSGADTRRPS